MTSRSGGQLLISIEMKNFLWFHLAFGRSSLEKTKFSSFLYAHVVVPPVLPRLLLPGVGMALYFSHFGVVS